MIINIDFDGTCTAHDFPRVGKDIGAIPVLKKLVNTGHKLILFTMRSDKKTKNTTDDPNIVAVQGNFLTDAVNWFKENGIPLYGIQANPTQSKWTKSPKSYAHLMIDDSSLGCPLKVDRSVSDKPFVDWVEVEKILIKQGIL